MGLPRRLTSIVLYYLDSPTWHTPMICESVDLPPELSSLSVVVLLFGKAKLRVLLLEVLQKLSSLLLMKLVKFAVSSKWFWNNLDTNRLHPSLYILIICQLFKWLMRTQLLLNDAVMLIFVIEYYKIGVISIRSSSWNISQVSWTFRTTKQNLLDMFYMLVTVVKPWVITLNSSYLSMIMEHDWGCVVFQNRPVWLD